MTVWPLPKVWGAGVAVAQRFEGTDLRPGAQSPGLPGARPAAGVLHSKGAPRVSVPSLPAYSPVLGRGVLLAAEGALGSPNIWSPLERGCSGTPLVLNP